MITDKDRAEWARHPVTQEFMRELRGVKQQTMEKWAAGAYTAPTNEMTVMVNASALGELANVDRVLDRVENMMLLDGQVQVEEGQVH